jgi:competence protein ComEA
MRWVRMLLVAVAVATFPASCAPDGGRASSTAPLLDLNAATEKQLETLPGIGPKHARSILASRNARGGRFQRLDDLLEIDGIGKETVEKIRPHVVLGPGR